MTNAEKFKEVFGFELNTQPFKKDYCIGIYLEECRKHRECGTCPYEFWDEKEYKMKTTRHTFYEDNIKAILECYFTGFKEEIINSACERILEQL